MKVVQGFVDFHISVQFSCGIKFKCITNNIYKLLDFEFFICVNVFIILRNWKN